MFLFFLGIHFMTMGSAVTLRYLAPLFVGIISILMYKKSMLPRQWFYFGLAFIGVYLIISKIGTKDHSLVVVFILC